MASFDKLPDEFIGNQYTPISRMEPGVEYPVRYEVLLLDLDSKFWIRKDFQLERTLSEYDHEDEQVYVSRRTVGADEPLTVRIPPSFSKRRKWSYSNPINPDKHQMIHSIIVE